MEADLPTRGNLVSVGRFKALVSLELLAAEFDSTEDSLHSWLLSKGLPVERIGERRYITLYQFELALLKAFGLTEDDLSKMGELYGALLKRDLRLRLKLDHKYRPLRARKLRKKLLATAQELG